MEDIRYLHDRGISILSIPPDCFKKKKKPLNIFYGLNKASYALQLVHSDRTSPYPSNLFSHLFLQLFNAQNLQTSKFFTSFCKYLSHIVTPTAAIGKRGRFRCLDFCLRVHDSLQHCWPCRLFQEEEFELRADRPKTPIHGIFYFILTRLLGSGLSKPLANFIF